jgi:pimeloyl-ACP methyl ester carboxylesterase
MRNEIYGWRLAERQGTSAGEVAYGVFGEGTPVVLVHGTPSRSYIWREIVPALVRRHRVYVYDLPGFGESERHEGQDVSIAAQGRALAELVGAWGLEEPMIGGHDIGAAVVLRAHLLEGTTFGRIALLDPLVLTPWGTLALWHVKEHLGSYRTMPHDVFEAYVAARLRQATSRPMDGRTFEAYLSQWRGAEGQKAYLRKDEALLERDTAEVEPLLGLIEVPVRILWGEEDGWVDPSLAGRLREEIPGSEVELVPGAGHFVMEDAPREVAGVLSDFFSGQAGVRPC